MRECRIIFLVVCSLFFIYGCKDEPSYKNIDVQCSSPFQASVTRVFSCNYGKDVSMEDAFKNMLNKRFQGELPYYSSVGLTEDDLPVRQILENPLPEVNSTVNYGSARYSAQVSNDNNTMIEYVIDIPNVFVLNLQVKNESNGKSATARYTFSSENMK